MPVARLAGLAVAVCLLASQTIVHAQKGRGPKSDPVDQPVIAWLATDGRLLEAGNPVDWEIPGEDTCESVPPGVINGDGQGAYVGDVPSDAGAFLRASDSEFVLDLRSGGGRYLYLNFTGIAPGNVPLSPRKEFCAVMLDQINFHTHFLYDDGTDDITKGLRDIPAGETYPARILSTFVIEGITYHVRFNASHYPGSSNVKITRGPRADLGLPSPEWWLIETGSGELDSGDVAQLVSPALTKKGNPGPNNEGFYYLPFRIVLTTDLTAQNPAP
jgi:hypothetical protein